MKKVTTQGILMSIMMAAGLLNGSIGASQPSEEASLQVLTALAANEQKVLELIKQSSSRELNADEAQILQSFIQEKAEILIAGHNPMY